MDRCINCGYKLQLRNDGKKICVNCGILPENQDLPEKEKSESEASYYG